ncbi:MAG: putative succinyl-diaminopimelate desuccinylase [Anaerolineae bacterium]|nr:putative succinyl-diaminopimelate desuccinylase [Anaerolineae bacterium]
MSLPPCDWDAVAGDAARLLSRYIQFDTTNPPGNELPALEFLAGVLRQNGLSPQILKSAPNRANLVVRLAAQPAAQAAPLLLYAHADVVPAPADGWSVPPFGGVIKDGYVWGRGALDDKGLGIIFLQALVLLHRLNFPRRRDIILLIAADEERCGDHGAAWMLAHHPDLIRAEFVWDEGGMGLAVSPGPLYCLGVAEKTALTLNLSSVGLPGHAAVPRTDNPHDRLVQALVRIKRWPQPVQLTPPVVDMLRALAPTCSPPLAWLLRRAYWPVLWPLLHGWVRRHSFFAPLVSNTISLTVLRGGEASNVSPTRAEARLDVRLLPGVSVANFVARLQALLADLDVQVSAESLPPPAVISPVGTPFFEALAAAVQQCGSPGVVTPYLTPGATDSRFFRAAGMHAYGFMPMLLDNAELSRIHGLDERVSLSNLRFGLQTVFTTLSTLVGVY